MTTNTKERTITNYKPGQYVGDYLLIEPRLINDIPCWYVHHTTGGGIKAASTLPEWLLLERAGR